MLEVEKWANGKSPLIAIIAPQIASITRDLPDVFRTLKQRRIYTHKFDVPHLPSWFAMYRSHRKYQEVYLNLISEAHPLGESLVILGAGLQELRRSTNMLAGIMLTSDQMQEGKQFWQDMNSASLDDLRDDFEGNPLDINERAIFQRYFSEYETELSFWFLVAAPCWLLYKMSPSHLYHKAITGEVNAIDKLLRLDPLMLHDPAIGKQIQKIRLSGKNSTYQRLVEAPLKPIKAKFTRSKVKASMAGFISSLASIMKQPLNEPDIRGIFDAVSNDADKQPIDTSLPNSPETFYKAIQRSRPDWKPILQPDKKK